MNKLKMILDKLFKRDQPQFRVFDAQKLTFKSGDILVVRFRERRSDEELQATHQVLKRVLPPEIKCLVTDQDVDFLIMTKAVDDGVFTQ